MFFGDLSCIYFYRFICPLLSFLTQWRSYFTCVKHFMNATLCMKKKMGWFTNHTNHSHLCQMFWPKIHDLNSIIHNRTIALSCSWAWDRHKAVSVGVMACGEATSFHLGGRETIRTNQAEIHNAPVTGSRFVWFDAHSNGLVTSCHR